jgi:FMN-dependent dehydrogenase
LLLRGAPLVNLGEGLLEHRGSKGKTSWILAGSEKERYVKCPPWRAWRGEVQGARAAASAGIPFTASTVGVCPVEEIQAAIRRPFWFQLCAAARDASEAKPS